MTSIRDPEAVHLGLDVHKDSISVRVLEPGSDSPAVDKIFHDEPSVRRLIDRFPDRSRSAGVLRGRPDRLRAAAAARVDGRVV